MKPMIGSPVTAYLLTDNLKRMLIISGIAGAFNGILGYQAAAMLDVSIADSMAVFTGFVFFLVFIFAHHRGLIRSLLRRRNQKLEFAKAALLFHLSNHENRAEENAEAGIDTIKMHMHFIKSLDR